MKYSQFLFLVTLVACSPSSGPEKDSSNMVEAKQAIDTGHEAFLTAMRTNDIEALLAQLTDDVKFLPPNAESLMGKEAIRSWYAGILKTVRTTDLSVTGREVVVAGEWGVEQADFKWTLKPVEGNDVIVDNGKFIAIWHRKADGSWALQRNIWNSSLSPAGSNDAQ